MTSNGAIQTCPHPGFSRLVTIPVDVEMPGFRELQMLRDSQLWWLWIDHCPICGENWLVAQEEEINDVIVMRRLSQDDMDSILARGIWPDCFNRYDDVIRIAQEAQRFHFFRPQDQLGQVCMLASERPGISVNDLADMLNMNYSETLKLAQRAVSEFNVQISLTGPS